MHASILNFSSSRIISQFFVNNDQENSKFQRYTLIFKNNCFLKIFTHDHNDQKQFKYIIKWIEDFEMVL